MFADRKALSRGLVRNGSVVKERAAFLAEDKWAHLDCEKLVSRPHRVAILNDTGSQLELDTIQGPALLVLNDTAYPGWKVYDRHSKQALEIRPVNAGFRSVFLAEQKTYDLRFSYQPAWHKWVWSLLVVGLALLVFFNKADRQAP